MTRIDFNPSLIRYHEFVHDARDDYFDCSVCIPKGSYIEANFDPVSLLVNEKEQVHAIDDLFCREKNPPHR